MCEDKKTGNKKDKIKKDRIMISDILNAISESEYPDYIIDAVERVQTWMKEMIRPEVERNDEVEMLRALFQFEDDEEDSLARLISSLESLKEYADVIPNSEKPEGKPDTLIVSITPPDYESGLRTAIDYAGIFNRNVCKRVWIISDTFIFDDVTKYSPYVDALSEQGITMRYILVTPWGWVELPLSGNMASKQSFLWCNEETSKRRKRKS